MPKPPIPGTKSDVLIIGGGMAGLVAAIETRSAGASVVLIDKLRSMAEEKVVPVLPGGPGNDTARAGGGGIARFENTASVGEMLKAHMDRSWGRADRELMGVYLERVAADCRWLRDELKMPYTDRNRVRGMGPGLARFLVREAAKRGVQMHFETRGLKLLTDGSDRVVGVRARGTNAKLDFHARAVILATGGFQGNQEMMVKYAGQEMTYGTTLTGCPTNTGDGHLMAMELGAQMINLNTCHVRTMDGLCAWGPSRELENIYPRGIYLNMECQRFVDEGTADSDTIANAIVFQPGHKAMLIFDETARAAFPDEWKRYRNKEKTIFSANTVDELAEKIGIEPFYLGHAVESFNQAVEEGRAASLVVPKTRHAVKIVDPPFYAFYPVLPGLNHPLGGLKVNTRCQVLDMENNPIAGLYAAGATVSWAFGKAYKAGNVMSYKGSYHAAMSSGLATALVFGRIAGHEAAAGAIEKLKN
ncbi:MAG: FAD-binding protein [Chloroflexi bacterium]|nr:FAD-binding protein [Chloroflexota bacterium]